MLAKAVYDNDAESKDELSFRKGDIVTVLEQNTGGLEGWWLCSLQGRQGIAPGNRLRILPGAYSGIKDKAMPEETYDIPPSHAWMSPGTAKDDDEYDVPRHQLNSSFQDTVDGAPIDSPNEVYDVPKASAWQQALNEDVYDTPTASVNRILEEDQEVYNVPSNLLGPPHPRELYDVPPIVSRDQHPNDVYDIPPRQADTFPTEMIPVHNPEEVYDVPPSSLMRDDSRKLSNRHESVESDVVYDIPQSNRMIGGHEIPAGLNSLRRMKREIQESQRSHTFNYTVTDSVEQNPEYVYDVPPQVSKDQGSLKSSADDVVDGLLQGLSTLDSPSQSDCLSTVSRESLSSYTYNNPLNYTELNLSVDKALAQLISLKQGLEDAVSKLLTLVKENWRKSMNIKGKIHEIQKLFVDVLKAATQFLIFSRGAAANAFSEKHQGDKKAPKSIQEGFRRLLTPLEEDAEMLKRALCELEDSNWSVTKLAVDSNKEDGTILDEVDSFVMTSRAVSDDADQMAVYIHSNSNYLFKTAMDSLSVNIVPSKSLSSESIARPLWEIQALQARPLPDVPPTQPKPTLSFSSSVEGQEGWLDDYDYVALPDKEDSEENNKESPTKPSLLSGLNKRKTQLLALEKEVMQPKVEVYALNEAEKEMLAKLEIDVPNLVQELSIAIDEFINAVDHRKPPPFFVALGKQVILCAHKLIFVGDCIHQRMSLGSAKAAVKEQCSGMCNVLKRTVASTKSAALHWPSVPAMQDTVDHMFQIAKCAHQIRLTLMSILSNI